jgi:probable rRNA maturation factor
LKVVKVDVLSKASGAPTPARVSLLLNRAARRTGCRAREVSVLFCGDVRMRRLNRSYRRKDRSTDVLAFPGDGGMLLGDIVVSLPYAAREAARRGDPVLREVDRLLLHGFLHLIGYDHEVDDGEMDALEGRLRRELGIASAGERRPTADRGARS